MHLLTMQGIEILMPIVFRIAVFLTILFVFCSCGMKTGEEALPLMNDGQRKTVEILKSFDASTTPQKIATSLGVDGSMKSLLTAEFVLVHDESESRVRAYFLTNSLEKIQYISLSPMWGYTVYYNELVGTQ